MILRFCLLVTSLLFAGSTAVAHPFHSSTTEIEWNDSSRRFEVAMRLSIADLEDALSAIQNRRVSVESDPARERLVKAYLTKHFSIGHKSDDECVLHWVGMELELHDAWIYFEVELADRPQVLTTPATDGMASPAAQSVEARPVKSWDDLFRRGPRPSKENKRGSDSLSPLHIRNSMLTDLQPEQENVVTVTVNSTSETAVLTRQAKTAELFTRKSAPHSAKTQQVDSGAKQTVRPR